MKIKWDDYLANPYFVGMFGFLVGVLSMMKR